jgi:hypothetical protein
MLLLGVNDIHKNVAKFFIVSAAPRYAFCVAIRYLALLLKLTSTSNQPSNKDGLLYYMYVSVREATCMVGTLMKVPWWSGLMGPRFLIRTP